MCRKNFGHKIWYNKVNKRKETRQCNKEMCKIIEFKKDTDTELTEYEKQVLKELEAEEMETTPAMQKVEDKYRENDLRIANGLEAKYDPADLFAEMLQAATDEANEN